MSPRRRISSSSVSSSRAPLAPTGWPSAIAPPFTFSLSGGNLAERAFARPSSARPKAGDLAASTHASTCAANASLISNSSI